MDPNRVRDQLRVRDQFRVRDQLCGRDQLRVEREARVERVESAIALYFSYPTKWVARKCSWFYKIMTSTAIRLLMDRHVQRSNVDQFKIMKTFVSQFVVQKFCGPHNFG